MAKMFGILAVAIIGLGVLENVVTGQWLGDDIPSSSLYTFDRGTIEEATIGTPPVSGTTGSIYPWQS
jgi:hypothetical protein